MSNAIILPNGILVNSYRIIGTHTRIYEAFEPSSYTGNHSIIQRFNDTVYGCVASRRTGNRSVNVCIALQFILDAYPHLETALQTDQARYNLLMGTIEIEESNEGIAV